MVTTTGKYELAILDCLEMKPFDVKRLKFKTGPEQHAFCVGLKRVLNKMKQENEILKDFSARRYTEQFDHKTTYYVEITRRDPITRQTIYDLENKKFIQENMQTTAILDDNTFRIMQLMKEGLQEGLNTPDEIKAAIHEQELPSAVKQRMLEYCFSGGIEDD